MDEERIKHFAKVIAGGIREDFVGRSGGDGWWAGCRAIEHEDILHEWASIAETWLQVAIAEATEK